MKHALTVLLSTASMCTSLAFRAWPLPMALMQTPGQSGATPSLGREPDGLETVYRAGSVRSIRLPQEALSGRMVIQTVIVAIT